MVLLKKNYIYNNFNFVIAYSGSNFVLWLSGLRLSDSFFMLAKYNARHTFISLVVISINISYYL